MHDALQLLVCATAMQMASPQIVLKILRVICEMARHGYMFRLARSLVSQGNPDMASHSAWSHCRRWVSQKSKILAIGALLGIAAVAGTTVMATRCCHPHTENCSSSNSSSSSMRSLVSYLVGSWQIQSRHILLNDRPRLVTRG